jgi:DNA (cytosine-5)-methyltransferase 1
MPAPATGATGYSSSPSGPARPKGSRLLPTPVAGAFNDGESVPSWLARRERQKRLGRNGNGIGTPLAIAVALLPTPLATDGASRLSPQLGGKRPSGTKRQVGLPEVVVRRLAGQERLLPTPDTGVSPNGHGRRGGRPGNGHQSGAGLDAAAVGLAPGTSGWGEYGHADRRWETVLGCPAPPPAEPGPSGRPRLSPAFAEWMMGVPGLVTAVPGISRTGQLRVIGNGVVPQQAAAALRLLITAAQAPPADGAAA